MFNTKINCILFLTAFLFLCFQARSQTVKKTDFDFDYAWGYHDHWKVSSKQGRVYIVVRHPHVYADTTIEITDRDKQTIYDQLNKINFQGYPEWYSPQPPPDHGSSYFRLEEKTDGNRKWIDTIYLYTMNMCEPHTQSTLIVYLGNTVKTVTWIPDPCMRPHDFTDERFNDLVNLGTMIEEIVRSKQGYRNLPKSGAVYK